MTLSERERLCREPGCKRAPACVGQAFCREHQPKWAPEWVRRAQAHALDPKVMAG